MWMREDHQTAFMTDVFFPIYQASGFFSGSIWARNDEREVGRSQRTTVTNISDLINGIYPNAVDCGIDTFLFLGTKFR